VLHKFFAILASGVLAAALLVPAATAAPSAGTATAATTATAVSASAALTNPKPKKPQRRKNKPDLKWKVPSGVIFNNPMVEKNRFVIERRILRAIRNTPKGEKIRIAAYSLDRQAVADELIAARKRGVKVQILLNDHIVPNAQVRIQQVLGRNTKKANFLRRCVSGCRADKNDYNNLHSKFYLFTRTGKSRNVIMLGSHNMTLNAVRWQWNDLWTTSGKERLFDEFVFLFNDMKKDWDRRRPTYTFCGRGRDCPKGDQHKLHTTVFPRHTTPKKDVVLDILNGVQCRYTDAAGAKRRTVLRLSMHSMRGNRGNYIADRLRQLYAEGCDLKVNYGLMGYHTKLRIGAPTARGRVPLRSTGFSLVHDQVDPSVPENIERYTHQKYFVLRGSYRGNIDTHMVWTGSTNWSSLGTPQDEILFSIRGRKMVRKYLANFNLMWRAPFSRDAYTTTYSVWRMVNGRPVGLMPRTTIEPDGVKAAGPRWEND
jgi:hypothetical protein